MNTGEAHDVNIDLTTSEADSFEDPGADWPLRCEVHGMASDRPATSVVVAHGLGPCLVCEECAQGRGPMRSLARAVTRSWVIRLIRQESALDLLEENTRG